jgi:hypothetical protein
MNATINHYSVFLLGILFAGMCLYGYWMFPVGPKAIVIHNAANVSVDKEVYHPGDRIHYTLDYCKEASSPARVHRTLVNSIKISYTEILSDLPTGCRKITVSDLEIPEFATPGIYHLESTSERQVNPLRTEYTTWRSVDFRIEVGKTREETEAQVQENTDDIEDINDVIR